MPVAAALLLLMLFLPCPLVAAEVRGYLLSLAVDDEPGSAPSAGAGAERPSFRSELAVGLRGRVQGVTWRVRAERHDVRVARRRLTTVGWHLQELARTFELSERWRLIAGKRVLAWDPSFSAAPLGFFQKAPDFSDATDVFERAEGKPLVALGYVTPGLDITLVYSHELGSEEEGQVPFGSPRAADTDCVHCSRGDAPIRQMAANVTWNHAGGTWSLVAHKSPGEAPGLGFTASLALGAAATAHVSVFGRDGVQRVRHHVTGFVWVPHPRTNLTVEWARAETAVRHAVVPPPEASNPQGSTEHVFIRAAYTSGRTSCAVLARKGLGQPGMLMSVSIDRRFNRAIAGGVAVTRVSAAHLFAAEQAYVSAQAWLKYAF